MKIQDSVVLVTGGNRGIGKALVEEALARGARKVYAGARDPGSVTTPGAVPLRLDVTDPATVAAAAREAGDVRVLINNAGISLSLDALTAGLDEVRQEFEVNYFGVLRMIQAFAPIIEANGGGHIQNINSALGLGLAPGFGRHTTYAATKAALLMATNGLRDTLPARGVDLSSLHVGYTDTDLVRKLDVPKNPVSEVARKAFDGIESDSAEVLVDEISVQAKTFTSLDTARLYPRSAA